MAETRATPPQVKGGVVPYLTVDGAIKALPIKQTKDELRESLLICTASEMIDRLKAYEELGVDELIMNGNIGHGNQESLDALERFAAEVMPLFSTTTVPASLGCPLSFPPEDLLCP